MVLMCLVLWLGFSASFLAATVVGAGVGFGVSREVSLGSVLVFIGLVPVPASVLGVFLAGWTGLGVLLLVLTPAILLSGALGGFCCCWWVL